MNDFFKVKFTIRPQNGCSPNVFGELIDSIHSWLNRKYGNPKVDAIISDWNSFIYGSTFGTCDSAGSFCAESINSRLKNELPITAWACKITEYPSRNQQNVPCRWITEIGYKVGPSSEPEISYYVGYEAHTKAVRKPPLNIPRVARSLLSDERWVCSVNDSPIDADVAHYRDYNGSLFGIEECRKLRKERAPSEVVKMIDYSVERTSFCRVGDYSGSSKWIYRLADIENGILSLPIIVEDAPKSFDNRNRLYWRNGPSSVGAFGVWDWSAIPNKNNPDTDYVETNYLENIQVTEIIEVPGATSVGELVHMLSIGVPVQSVSPSTFFCYRNTRDTLIGVLCIGTETTINNGKTLISEETQSLPVYEIKLRDAINLEGKTFYKRLSFEGDSERILVKEPVDIIRDIILKRTTWSAVKPFGVTKKEWRSIRDLIVETPIDTIYQEIASACHCSEADAKEYVDRFIENIESYIDDDSYDNQVLVSMLERHSALRKKCEDIVSEQWEDSHRKKIESAQKELDAIISDTGKKQAELESYNESVSALLEKISLLKHDAEEQEKLAASVTERVRERIANAKSDAASFISEMAFLMPTGNKYADNPERGTIFKQGTELDLENLEICNNWKETIETLSLELIEAGVAEKLSHSLASLLYSAFINHVPVLLAGPNGDSIADAFSASLFGRTAGRIDCSTSYDIKFASQFFDSDDPVITITNALRNDWITHIPEMLNSDKFIFIVHPFAEDLLIEPKSLYAYVMPVLTEFLIDNVPTRNFVGAKRAANYSEFEGKKGKPLYEKMLKSFGFGMLVRLRMQKMMADFHGILESENADYDCLYLVFPYAYSTCLSRSEMIEHISVEMNISHDLVVELKNYMGIRDE